MLKLDISNNKIAHIDPEFFESGMSLTHLKLSKNQLVTVPEQINKLKYLKTLDISSNRIRRLPLEVFENLKILRIEWPIYHKMITSEMVESFKDS